MSTKSLREMKKSRKSLQEKIVKESEKTRSGTFNKDERFWEPTLDSAGNGSATIRFLPPPKGEELPWVRLFTHFFRGPGGVYAERSLTTIGKDDPVSEYNSILWNRGDEEGKEQAREQKRKLNYYANIYIVDDKGNPDNNGKVFLYKFGKVIFDKINEVQNPDVDEDDDDDEVEPVNPFDFWEGANFRLKIRNNKGWRNYDKSYFEDPSELSEDDEELEKIWSQQYSLESFLDPKEFKPYDELKTKLNRVLGLSSTSSSSKKTSEPKEEDEEEAVEEKEEESSKEEVSDDDGEEEDNLDYFRRLASED